MGLPTTPRVKKKNATYRQAARQKAEVKVTAQAGKQSDDNDHAANNEADNPKA